MTRQGKCAGKHTLSTESTNQHSQSISGNLYSFFIEDRFMRRTALGNVDAILPVEKGLDKKSKANCPHEGNLHVFK